MIGDKGWEERLQVPGKELRYNLVMCVTQSNRAIICYLPWSLVGLNDVDIGRCLVLVVNQHITYINVTL